jgi:hypothetical protein
MTRDKIDHLWQHALGQSVHAGESFTRYHFTALVLEEAAKVAESRIHAGEAGPAIIVKAIRALKPEVK